MKDIYRYGTEVNSHDLLKVLAISTMVVDHIGKYFLVNTIWLRVIGRMAAPQFFFLVGYSGSYRFKREILLYGLALSIVNYLTNTSDSILEHIFPLNILIGFVLIKELLNRFDPSKLLNGMLLLLLAILMLVSLPTYILIEYGSLGLGYAIGARLVQQRHGLRVLWMSITVLVQFFFEMVFTLIRNADVSTQMLPYMIGLLVLVFATNLAIFLNYKFRIFRIENKYLKTIIIYVSRYSLEIYFFHLSLFMIIHYI